MIYDICHLFKKFTIAACLEHGKALEGMKLYACTYVRAQLLPKITHEEVPQSSVRIKPRLHAPSPPDAAAGPAPSGAATPAHSLAAAGPAHFPATAANAAPAAQHLPLPPQPLALSPPRPIQWCRLRFKARKAGIPLVIFWSEPAAASYGERVIIIIIFYS